jgi:hypothetical protein
VASNIKLLLMQFFGFLPSMLGIIDYFHNN